MNLAPLAPGAEFDKIRSIWRALGERGVHGGDDAAIVELGGARVAIATDMMLEGVHFRLGWLRPHEIGWRAGAAALSDMAAVAATPRGVLVSLGVRAEWPDQLVTDVMDGLADVAESVGAKVWGGDLIRSEKLVIDVAAVGEVARPVLRSGASVGDTLWVTGFLGGPLAALLAWQDGREPDRSARERFAAPRPRVNEAQWLRDRGATAMIDVSDGLAADAEQVGAASNVRWRIEARALPVHPSAENAAALASGEEFELLVALPRDVDRAVGREFESRFQVPLTRIGRAEQGTGVEVFDDGEHIDVRRFQHF